MEKMSANTLTKLEKLGIDQDITNCEDFHILENLLSQIHVDNILSTDEIEALEYAELKEMDDDDIVKKLKEHGIDEDVLEVNESSLEYFQNKLKFLESDKWDSIINDLRGQNAKLKITLEVLEKKLVGLNIDAHVKSGEEIWRKTRSGLEELFQELKLMNTRNDLASDSFKEFLVSFQKESNLFIECVTPFVKQTKSEVIPNSQGKTRESAAGDILCDSTKDSSAKLHRETSSTEIKNRLIATTYNVCKEKVGCLDRIEFDDVPTSTLEVVNRDNLDLMDNILILSEKQIMLQSKENEDLHDLKCIQAEREFWLQNSEELILVLKKQQVLLDLVSVLKFIWYQPYRETQKLLNYCIEHFHEELANMKTRIGHLTEHKTKFESYFNGKFNILHQKLEQLTNFNLEEECLQNMITTLENKLQLTIHQQIACLSDSERHLSEVENNIARVEDDVDANMKIISELTTGFSTALQLLEVKKDERINLNCMPMKNCEMT